MAPQASRPNHCKLLVQVESRRGYNLDMSFFERLVSQGHPVVTLQQQRRMRPSISALIRPLYPDLQVSCQRDCTAKLNLPVACLGEVPYCATDCMFCGKHCVFQLHAWQGSC